MIHIDKCKKKCDVITFSENKMSTKMLKAMMLKMGSGKISYHNSRTRNTHTIIMSLNYVDNRLLLLRYKYKLYFHYVKTLSNINKDLYAKILLMLDTLVADLSQDERNIVFDTPPPDPPIPEDFEDSGIVFKVITKRLRQFSYFILINIKNSYIFETGLFYTFDLSDPSNLGTAFCVSLEKDGVSYDCRYNLTPGEPGATMKLHISKGIPYTHLYVFNKEEDNKGIQYEQWGYSYNSLFINRDKLQMDDVLSSTFKTFTTSYLKFVVYDWYGPKIMIDPFVAIEANKSSNPVRLYKNTYMYKFGIGVHYIYLNNHYSLAFLNRNKYKVGISSQYNRGTKYLDQLFIAGSGLDGNYSFHSGLIRLTISGPFDPITLYNDKYGYMGGLFMIQYTENNLKTAIPDEFVSTNTGDRYGLDSHTVMDTSLFTFQNIPYNPVNRFAVAPGDYIFYNTSNVPVTLLNKGKESWISIEGISKKIVNGLTVTDSVKGIGPNGQECEFLYGPVYIRVRGNFGSCSLYTPRKGPTEGGYRGGYGLLEYDASFSNVPSYVAREMDPPVFTVNTAICTVPIEVTPKPTLTLALSLNEYAMTTTGLFKGSVQQGNINTNDMRFKLETRGYTFLLDGIVTIYGEHALLNTRSIGLNSILYGLYPVYNSTFFVDSVFLEDFTIVYTKGSVKYTYFFTYQT
jgi:hypothetical protein